MSQNFGGFPLTTPKSDLINKAFSKSEEMRDKIIGWYLTINHYH